MPPLPLNALRVFEAVARCGSFRIAAEELCVSQSAVSHQIKHLEEWFAKPLFDRSGNRPRLLPAGDELARELSGSFRDIYAACERVQRINEHRTLVIAAIPSVAVCWLIPGLPEFRLRHPGITIRVIYAIHGQHINFSEVDLAFVFGKSPPAIAGTEAHWFASGKSIPVGNPSLSEKLKGTDTNSNILNAGLLHDTDISGWTNWFIQSGSVSAPELSGPVFEDFNLLRAAALSGQGVALCPLDIIHTDLKNNLLVPLSSQAIHEDCNYYLLQRDSADSEMAKLLDSFKQWLFEKRDSETRP